MYDFDEQPTTNRPQILDEQMITEKFGSLFDLDELPEARQRAVLPGDIIYQPNNERPER